MNEKILEKIFPKTIKKIEQAAIALHEQMEFEYKERMLAIKQRNAQEEHKRERERNKHHFVATYREDHIAEDVKVGFNVRLDFIFPGIANPWTHEHYLERMRVVFHQLEKGLMNVYGFYKQNKRSPRIEEFRRFFDMNYKVEAKNNAKNENIF